jgi:riboflavin kinase/FMN adenylyltransferase
MVVFHYFCRHLRDLMNIYNSLDNLPNFNNAVVTIGSFDGVHKAHKNLIEKINQLSKEVNGESIVVTFHPHPRSIVFPNDKSLKLLTDKEEKIDLLGKAGVQNLIIIPFNVEFAQLSAQEYVEKFIISKLKAKYLIVGYDHKFGLARQGDYALLKSYEKQGAFQLIELEKQVYNDIAISSTNIRNAVLNNDFELANGLIGGHYIIKGKVTKGDGIGKTIGYPTANIKVSHTDKLLPDEGIYASYTVVHGIRYKSMLYIGNRPSINDEKKKVVEVNIFDFNENIYDDILTIEIVTFLRKDVKFSSLEELKTQLDLDRKQALNTLLLEEAKTIDKDNLSIAILNYNGRETLSKYLPDLIANNERSAKLIVIDNRSTDDSVAYIKENFPQIEVIPLRENYGFANGYNKGIEYIKSKYVLLLNNDVRVSENWLSPLINAIESDSTIAGVQPKILSDRTPNLFEHAGAAGGYIDILGYPFCRGRIFDQVEEDLGQYNDVKEIFWTSGAAMLVRREIFKDLGGFDGDFFAHMEEIDFCWRVKRAGYKFLVIPESIVYHYGGGTLGYDNPNKTYLNFRNNLSMLLKNHKKRTLWLVFILRLILDGVAGLKFLLEGKFRHTIAIIKAHFTVYFTLPQILAKRASNYLKISKYKVGKYNSSGYFNRSIIFDYYINKKRKFQDLNN